MEDTDCLLTMEIVSEEKLFEACDMLHDAYLDAETMSFDSQSGCWKGRFEREFFEDGRLIRMDRKFLWFRRYRFPLCETLIEFTNLSLCELKRNTTIQRLVFSDVIKEAQGTYMLRFVDDSTIRVKFVGPPSGSMKDTHLLSKSASLWCPGKWPLMERE